jgi:hypothetical protein
MRLEIILWKTCVAACLIGSWLHAQPKVGLVEVFGAHRTGRGKIEAAAGAKAGGPLPRSRVEAEENIEAIGGIVQARVEAVCCERGEAILYIGVQERGSAVPEFLPEPAEDLSLPDAALEAYREYTQALERAGRGGETEDSLAEGHALSAGPAVRAAQERMLALGEERAGELRQVLRRSQDSEQRAIAAFAIQYLRDKGAVAEDLQKALRDAGEGVRRNAMRSLEALAVLARRDPASGVKVSGVWLVELLNSLVWSDRVGAARTLLVLTETPGPHLTANIKERALVSLAETAAWKHLPHALPAFLLLGRVAGWTDNQTQQAWSSGEREQAIERMRRALRPR